MEPLPPLLKGGQDLPKNESLVGVPKTLLERGENPENGVDVEMGGLPLFYYFTVQLHLLCVGVCVGWVKVALLHSDSSIFWVNHAGFSAKSSHDSHHLYIFYSFWQCTENVDCFTYLN